MEPNSKFTFLKPPSTPNSTTSRTVTILTIVSSKKTWNPFCMFTICSSEQLVISTSSVSVVACIVGLCITLTQALDAILRMEPWSLVLVSILAFVLLLVIFFIWRHPQNPTKATFMVMVFQFVCVLPSKPLPKKIHLTFCPLSTGALPPCTAYTEHTHQCLPNGAVRLRHMAPICYLDVSR